MSQLALFHLNDNGEGTAFGDEVTWASIWAPDFQAAERLFRRWYEAETGNRPGEYSVGYSPTSLRSWGGLDALAPEAPGHERRPEVLREIGWRCEGDWTCDTCGLAEMDGADEVWHVCRECNQCGECGHDDDCPNHPASGAKGGAA